MLADTSVCCRNFGFYFGNLASGNLTTKARNRNSGMCALERAVGQNCNKSQKFCMFHVCKEGLFFKVAIGPTYLKDTMSAILSSQYIASYILFVLGVKKKK